MASTMMMAEMFASGLTLPKAVGPPPLQRRPSAVATAADSYQNRLTIIMVTRRTTVKGLRSIFPAQAIMEILCNVRNGAYAYCRMATQ